MQKANSKQALELMAKMFHYVEADNGTWADKLRLC